MKKISVIVPIYNIKDYIIPCVESILMQFVNDLEIILVDDGSTDGSSVICDGLAEDNNIVRVLHKKNGGLSDARNAGLSISRGYYIIFLDGDDMLVENSLRQIRKILDAEEPDLLTCDFVRDGKLRRKIEIQTRPIRRINDYLEFLYDIPWAAWRSVYKASIIKKNGLEYKKKLVGAEDCEFFVRYFENCKKIIYTNIDLINYQTSRNGSITNNLEYNVIMGELETFKKYYNKFMLESNDEIRRLFARKYVNTVTTIGSLKAKREKRGVVGVIRKNKKIVFAANGIKYFLYKVLFVLFGYYNSAKIIDFLRRRSG